MDFGGLWPFWLQGGGLSPGVGAEADSATSCLDSLEATRKIFDAYDQAVPTEIAEQRWHLDTSACGSQGVPNIELLEIDWFGTCAGSVGTIAGYTPSIRVLGFTYPIVNEPMSGEFSKNADPQMIIGEAHSISSDVTIGSHSTSWQVFGVPMAGRISVDVDCVGITSYIEYVDLSAEGNAVGIAEDLLAATFDAHLCVIPC